MPTEILGGSVRRFSILVLASICCCGRTEGGTQQAAGVTRDSAGVLIHAYPPEFASVDSIRLTEEVRFASASEGPLLSRLAGGLFLPDGSVVLADGGALEVYQFSADGRLTQTSGGEGEGPGEFSYVRAMGRCAPSGFVVFDIDWTMSEYDSTGTFLRERPVRLSGGSSPYQLACSRTGRLAVNNWKMPGSNTGNYVALSSVHLLRADGSLAADLGERIMADRFRAPTNDLPHPAGRGVKFGFLGEDLIVADGGFFGFERWSPDGTLREVVRLDVPRPDGDSLMSVYLDDALARATNEDMRRRWRQQVLDLGLPEAVGFLSDLRVLGSRIFVRELDVRGSGRWFAFSSDGTPSGFLPLPHGVELLDADPERLLLARKDSLDVPYAAVYSVSGWQ